MQAAGVGMLLRIWETGYGSLAPLINSALLTLGVDQGLGNLYSPALEFQATVWVTPRDGSPGTRETWGIPTSKATSKFICWIQRANGRQIPAQTMERLGTSSNIHTVSYHAHRCVRERSVRRSPFFAV